MAQSEKTVTLPELAKLIDMLPDTLRMWFRRDYFEGREDHNKGWKRFTLKEASRIACFAEVFRKTKDREFSLRSIDALSGHIAESLDGFAPEGLWLVLYRYPKEKGVLAGAETLEAVELETEDEMLAVVRELTDGTTHGVTMVFPTVIPIHRLWATISLQLYPGFGPAKSESDSDG